MQALVRVRALVFFILFVCAAREAGAQLTFAPGTRIQASPTQTSGNWQDCVVVSGPDRSDNYQVKCDRGSETTVPGKWIRPAGGPKALRPLNGPIPPPPAAAPPAAAPAAPRNNGGGAVALGAYECWAWGRPRLLLNFQVTGPGRYTASDDSAGTFTFDPGSKAIRFTGYLANVMPTGFTSIYHVSDGTPTVSFRGPGGSEASFCEKAN